MFSGRFKFDFDVTEQQWYITELFTYFLICPSINAIILFNQTDSQTHTKTISQSNH